jgi:hypothetical protein
MHLASIAPSIERLFGDAPIISVTLTIDVSQSISAGAVRLTLFGRRNKEAVSDFRRLKFLIRCYPARCLFTLRPRSIVQREFSDGPDMPGG